MKTNDSVKPLTDWMTPIAAALALGQFAATAQTPAEVAIPMQATVATASPVITLNWPDLSANRGKFYITRTELTATGRGSSKAFTLATNAVSLADTNAVVGKRYEYSANQTFYLPSGAAASRKVVLTVGSEIPLVENRGRVLLLVDATVAAPLAAELETYARDLALEGWTVVRRDVARMAVSPEDSSAAAGVARTAELATTRQQVLDFYNADKVNSRSVVLIGRVPVPYSGKIMPDGHTDHQGAWPTDMYYADMTGSWTDTAQNWAAAGRLSNVPGDGKLDQNDAPSTLELEVGRIDFAGLPSQTRNEVELLRQYLVRNHAYRHGLAPFDAVRREVLVDDNFGYFGGEAFAAVGWNIGTAVVGRENARSGDWFTDLTGTPTLFGYGCGGGGYTGASGVGGSGDFASRPSRAVFNVLFGSYFGDWNMSDGFLRSSLAGPADSTGLTAVWGNRPNWDFSVTATGGTVGSTLRYSTSRAIHRTLLGDPTLSVQARPAVANLLATPTTDGLKLTWDSLGLGELGYHVYRTELATGITTRLTGEAISATAPDGRPLTATEYLNTGVAAGSEFAFTVRPVFRELTPGGTYYGLGLGSVIEASQPGARLAVQKTVSRQASSSGDVDLILTGSNTEPRNVGGNLQLVVRFNQPVTGYELALAGGATITSHSLSPAGDELIVQVGQVVNRQCLRLNLSGVTGAHWSAAQDFSFPVRVLAGDVTGNGVVDIYDANRLAAFCRTTRGVAKGGYRVFDFNGDGLMNASDILFALSKRGSNLD